MHFGSLAGLQNLRGSFWILCVGYPSTLGMVNPPQDNDALQSHYQVPHNPNRNRRPNVSPKNKGCSKSETSTPHHIIHTRTHTTTTSFKGNLLPQPLNALGDRSQASGPRHPRAPGSASARPPAVAAAGRFRPCCPAWSQGAPSGGSFLWVSLSLSACQRVCGCESYMLPMTLSTHPSDLKQILVSAC